MLTLFGNIHVASADVASDTESLLNWAEINYPDLFPSRQATQSVEPWLYRYYPETGIYVGVNKIDNNVYLLGGEYGDVETIVDTLPNLMAAVGSGNVSNASCDTSDVLPGVTYTQSGNIVSVTTNGCVAFPDLDTSICKTPQQTAATGISLLGTNTVTSSSLEGITISIPGIPNPLTDIISASANAKHCTINAPSGTANLVVNSDLCLDITSLANESLAGLPIPGMVVTPPIKYITRGTYTSQAVPNCFETNATTISDAFTGESWVKQGTEWVNVTAAN